MSTSTFDRMFIVTDPEEQHRIWDVISSDEPATPISVPPYTDEERNRSVELLKQSALQRQKRT